MSKSNPMHETIAQQNRAWAKRKSAYEPRIFIGGTPEMIELNFWRDRLYEKPRLNSQPGK